MPRADARLLAIDELISRGGMRRCECTLDDDDVRLVVVFLAASFLARSSATAAEVDTFFSAIVVKSASVTVASGAGFSESNFISSESRRWCASSRCSVLKASWLHVEAAAFENSPAARVCSFTATVVSDFSVAADAFLAWS
jgi:hypothetical protein